MKIKRFMAIARLNLLIQLRDPTPTILMTIIPLILTPFMIPSFKTLLISEGYASATGAEQVVPGMAVLFSFLSVQFIVQSFFDEHTWGTWPRLRSTAATPADIIMGKTAVIYLIQAVQLIVVLAAGSLLYGYRPNGSIAALVIVALVFSAVLTAFGVVLSLWIRSENTALALASLVGMLMAGIGGAIGSTSGFPGWARPVSKISPAYWALDAVHKVSLDSAGIGDVGGQIGILLIFLAVLVAVCIIRCIMGVDTRKME